MHIQEIANHLNSVGYIVLEQPLLRGLSSRLLGRCQAGDSSGFQPAQVGRGSSRQHIPVLRSDAIRWLDDADSTDHSYLDWMEQLRLGLNAALYLGLFAFEAHYAIYTAGAGYARHSDVLSGARNRILSTVLYLNSDWQSSDGGELHLFAPVGEVAIATVRPTFGKMIIFLSESFPHEVLASRTTRRSIAGWFSGRPMV